MTVQNFSLINITTSDLTHYCLDYIREHIFFKCMDIARAIMKEQNCSVRTRGYNEELKPLIQRITKIIKTFKEKGFIAHYSLKTYKRIANELKRT